MSTELLLGHLMPKIRVSPTQIKAFTNCPRTWVAGWVLGDRQPQSEAMAFGTVGHKHLEIYQRTGRAPDEKAPWQFSPESDVRFPGKSAMTALKHIPKPKTGEPEQGFLFTLHAGDLTIEFIGYIDLEWKQDGAAWLMDYKFTSGFQNALSEETLKIDPQALIYATKAFLCDGRLDEVHLRWLYILSTKTPRSRPVDITLTSAETKSGMRQLVETIKDMYSLRCRAEALRDAIQGFDKTNDEHVSRVLNQLPATVEACGNFGGCYYTDRCELTEEQLIRGDMNMGMSPELRAKLEAKGFLKAEAPAPSPAPKAEAPAPAPEAEQPAPSPAPANATKAEAPAQAKVDKFAKYKKTPAVPAANEPREEPTVRLNAPENYLEEAPKTASFSAADKAALKVLLNKLIDTL